MPQIKKKFQSVIPAKPKRPYILETRILKQLLCLIYRGELFRKWKRDFRSCQEKCIVECLLQTVPSVKRAVHGFGQTNKWQDNSL